MIKGYRGSHIAGLIKPSETGIKCVWALCSRIHDYFIYQFDGRGSRLSFETEVLGRGSSIKRVNFPLCFLFTSKEKIVA